MKYWRSWQLQIRATFSNLVFVIFVVILQADKHDFMCIHKFKVVYKTIDFFAPPHPILKPKYHSCAFL